MFAVAGVNLRLYVARGGGKTCDPCNNGPVPRPSLVSIAAVSLVLAASACSEAPSIIVLGPLPKRPVDPRADDAGQEIPDGAIACKSDSDCDDGVDCTYDACLSEGYCTSRADYTRCSDDQFCNGIEICDALKGCLPGVVPTCDDMDPCTIDRCDDEARECVHAPRDFDHDGETDVHCNGGTDCDDFDPTRGSQRGEICSDAIDNDCDDQIDEQNCGHPEHDSCQDALDISQGGTFEVSLLGALSDYTPSCTKMVGASDVVFTFELTKTSDVKLAARGFLIDGTEESAAISLQSKCGVTSSELKCSENFPPDLRVRALAPGRYYVIASSHQAASLWLSYDVSPPTKAQTNAKCSEAIDVSQGGRFEGDFIDVGDETMSVCGTEQQPDVYYKFTLDKESDVEISAVSDEPGTLTIGVRDSCDELSTVRGCRSAEPALTRLHQLPAGSYVIVLEGPSSRELSYALEVAILPPTPVPQGDNCSSPIPLTVGMPSMTTLTDKQAEVPSSCESNGPDAVFSLHLDTAQDVDIQADAEDVIAVCALQQICGDVGTERMCRKGGPLQMRVSNVEPGDYYIVVDSPVAQSVTLLVQTYPPTPTVQVTGNDTCATAYEIFGSGGIFTGDTRSLHNDYTGDCAASSSHDAVYKLQLNDRRHVAARLESGFDSVLHRKRDQRTTPDVCMNVQSEMCVHKAQGSSTSELDEFLVPGVYYYIVDGFDSYNSGFYTFTVVVTAP
jgi:Putative metal-binding motif